jgi:two-component system sensor histidine kinase RpfC
MPKVRQVLLVENCEKVVHELTGILGEMGFKVTVLDDPEGVSDALAGRDYEIALMNMTLPGMNWRRTLAAIKNAAKTTTVLSLREAPNEDDVRLALNAGAYAVLYRPLSAERLTSLLLPRNDGMFVANKG